MPQGLFIKRQDNHMHTRCWRKNVTVDTRKIDVPLHSAATATDVYRSMCLRVGHNYGPSKMAEPIEMLYVVMTHEVKTGATWWIQLNNSCMVATMAVDTTAVSTYYSFRHDLQELYRIRLLLVCVLNENDHNSIWNVYSMLGHCWSRLGPQCYQYSAPCRLEHK